MSLDVVNLFPRIPTVVPLTVVRDTLAADFSLEGRTCIAIDNLMEMLNSSVETTYLRIGSGRKTGNGITIVPNVLADVCIKYFEEIALGSSSLKTSMRVR